ncbi:MAG: hypothetical protein A2787_04825 [Omnitrophica WOR_2 bacterium RIFCSPHIGHO2_01_FULL_48_9]|nr:MAG: hypothetical protein A3D10_03635 [Omnitrophica WOR_2 bacterium RIFCSPHIGHO2_02_FULL_48_11]OGX33243.1 MAG: hypothetical protein A2787_04825 [Omnitrophica WOR_2 bacterium RIFCSPHIGHO2_01_FULL_48_9]
MRFFKITLIFLSLFVSQLATTARPVNAAEPFAVVELFTSQGCSDCPPADALLRALTEDAYASKARIFTLSFHVDYWNNLGWVDPFSSAQFTERQRLYAKINKARTVYTPQLIINGTRAFAGYNYDLAQQSLSEVLSEPAAVALELEIFPGRAITDSLELSYDVTGAAPSDLLHIALVERGLTSDISSGENAGLRSAHHNVVRSFQTISLKKSHGMTEINIPQGVVLKNASLIGFVQNPNDMIISGAAGLDLVNPFDGPRVKAQGLLRVDTERPNLSAP